jgi:hypothetical protein
MIAGAAALALALTGSTPYPGVSVDSGEYLAVAEGLLAGEGLTMPYASYDEAYRILTPGERVPMTQFPPFYPALLALLSGIADASLLVVARAVGAISYALFVTAGSYLVWRATTSTWFGAVAAGLLLAPDLVSIHAMAWSEQLMLLALCGCVLFATRYLEGGRRPDLAALGACAVAGSLARFAGVSMIIGGAILVWRTRTGSPRRRALAGAAFVAVTIAPTVAWFVRNSLVTGAVSEKQPAWHPPSLTVLGQAMQTIGGWLVPWRVATMAAGLLVVAVTVVWLTRRRRAPAAPDPASVTTVCLVLGASYVGFLLIARAVIDQNIPFDNRLLSPLQTLAAIGLCVTAARMTSSARRRAGVAALAVLAGASVVRGTVTAIHFSGTTVAAYSGDRWRSSETLAYARRLPRSTLVITNAPDPLWLWDRRATQILPPRSSLYSGEANENYSEQLRDLLASTRCRRAVLVFFSQPTRKPPRRVDPVVAGDLRVSDPTTLEDGVVFEIDEPPCPEG